MGVRRAASPPRAGRRGALPALLLLVLLAAVLALGVMAGRAGARPARGLLRLGGAARSPGARARAERQDVVVDTLNLTHHLLQQGTLQKDDEGVGATPRRAGARVAPLTRCDILAAIRYATPVLRQHFSGRIIYVVKDRDSLPNSAASRALYLRTARETGAHVHIVERPSEARPRASWQPAGAVGATHQRAGRDDFYLGLLAWKLRCGALTEDRMRDFERLKSEVDPFVVLELAPWAERPAKNYVNPGARDYARVGPPTRLAFADYGLAPA